MVHLVCSSIKPRTLTYDLFRNKVSYEVLISNAYANKYVIHNWKEQAHACTSLMRESFLLPFISQIRISR